MNIDRTAIVAALTAAGLTPEAAEIAADAAVAQQERAAIQAELDAAKAALQAATERAKALGLIAEPTHTTSRAKRVAGGRPCACGCGAQTQGGVWMPGHDAKHGGYKARVAVQ